MNNNSLKEVFVFGAGASFASAKLPLGKDLVWTYYEDCSSLYEVENGEPTKSDLRKRNEEFIDYRNFLALANKIFPKLRVYDRWQRCMEEATTYSFPVSEKKYYVDELVRILQKSGDTENVKLVKQLTAKHIRGTSAARKNLPYKHFVKYLIQKSPEHTSIISMNFDSCLHENCQDHVYFDYIIPFDEIDENRISYNKSNGFPLLKLNGSLDWEICTKCKKTKLLHYANSHVIPYGSKCCFCETHLSPYVFLPHEEKDCSIKPLWAKASEVLRRADEITVIGYSFPDYDKDIKALFNNNISSNVVLNVIDYAENEFYLLKIALQKKYKEMFDLDINNISLSGFEKYARSDNSYIYEI